MPNAKTAGSSDPPLREGFITGDGGIQEFAAAAGPDGAGQGKTPVCSDVAHMVD